MNYSLTFTGAIASLLVTLAAVLQIDLPYTEAEAIVLGVTALVTLIVTAIGRYRAGGVTPLGIK